MTEHSIPQDFYVYAHHRADTGKIFYIGKGKNRRAWDTKHGRSKHWKAVVDKHGFEVRILQSGLQDWAARELECDMIALHGRRDLGHGPLVNFTDGGDGTAGALVSAELAARRGVAISEALKIWHSENESVWTGRKHSEASKAKQSAKKKAMPLPAGFAAKTGRGFKPHERSVSTPEGRAKLAATCKRQYASGERVPLNRRAITSLTTGQVFVSMNEAVAKLKTEGFPKATQSSIGRCCRGLQAEAYGQQWAYTDESVPLYQPKEGGAPKRSVLREADGLQFESLSAAARWCKDNGYPKAAPGSVCAALKGLQGTAYGSTWRYVDPQKQL